MGGHINGDHYGLVTSGERAGLLVEGKSYTTGYYAVLNKDDEGEYIPSYASVSTRTTIYASGVGVVKNKASETDAQYFYVV